MPYSIKFIILLTFTALCTSIGAQKKAVKTAPRGRVATSAIIHKPKISTIDSLISHYQFDEAISLIERGLDEQAAASYHDSLTQRQHQAHKGNSMIEATQKVVFVDSQVVSRERMLQAISTDKSCGQLLTAKQIKELLADNAQPVGIGFINGFGDQLFFGQKAANGTTRLMQANLYGDKWSTPTSLFDINNNTTAEGFPFMMADGATFYFAAQDEGSLGGYDIYVTRYDASNGTFLKPENVGMPFNSPANDYLMIYDEVNRLGWFVSDRNQPADKVCVYTFIPDEGRETYEVDTISTQLRHLAAIHSIAATQKGNQTAVADAAERLKQVRNAKMDIAQNTILNFDLAYEKRYTSIDEFKNAEAKKLAVDWAAQTFRRAQLAELLQENRLKYANARSEAERKAIAPIILRQEGELDIQDEQIVSLANQIRTLEN